MNKLGCLVVALLVVQCILPVIGASGLDGSDVPGVRAARRTIVVDAGGGGDYTRIQDAIDNANNGDTVYVEAGTYYENVKIDKRITLTGSDNANTIIDGMKREDVVQISEDGVWLENLKTINSSLYYRYAGIKLDRVERCQVVNNNCSMNEGYGIDLDGSSNNVIMDNEVNNNWREGIRIGGIDNQIIGNSCNSNAVGIHTPVGYNVICNNTCTNNFEAGISLETDYGSLSPCFNVVENNTVTSHNAHAMVGDRILYGHGIYIRGSSSNTIRNNVALNNTCGIYVWESNGNLIENNSCKCNEYAGIGISSDWPSSEKNIITNNIVSRNKKYGLLLLESIENSISGNRMIDNGICMRGASIIQYDSHSIDMTNTVNSKPAYYWKNMNGKTVPSGAGQIILVNCTNIAVENQEITGGTVGVHLAYSSRISVRNCLLKDNGAYGILIEHSELNSISGNRMENSYSNNICLMDSYHQDISDNQLTGSGIYISDQSPQAWNTHNIDTLNSVNGNPVYYFKFQSERYVNVTAGQIIIVNCTYLTLNDSKIENGSGVNVLFSSNVFITNNRIVSNCNDGLYLYSSTDCLIENNTSNLNNNSGVYSTYSENCIISGNICDGNGEQAYFDGTSDTGNGIYIYSSDDFMVTNNSCRSNIYNGITLSWLSSTSVEMNKCNSNLGDGISTHGSDDCKLSNNTCVNNSEHGFIVTGYSERNVIIDNLCMSNDCGIEIYYTDNNVVSSNLCYSNRNFGINLTYYTHDNLVCNNILIQNMQDATQANDDGENNRWNANEGGNYWSDWTSPDLNGDGIVDKPYNMAGTSGSRDNLPLVDFPFEVEPEADAGSDIAAAVGRSVTFNGTNSTSPYAITHFDWSFVYDSIEVHLQGPSPPFTFDIPGEYMVKLYVENEAGFSDTDHVRVMVLDDTPPVDNQPPIADAGGDIVIDQHETVQFDGNASHDDMGIVNHTWSFVYQEREILLYGLNAAFMFDDAGMFPICLNVTDAAGNWATDTLEVTVNDITPPIADAGLDINIKQNQRADFSAINSSDNVNIAIYTWTFEYHNAEHVLYGMNLSLTFVHSGTYNVTLTVFDLAGNYNMDYLTITVLELPIPIDIDSDNDTFNDTYENASGSDPFNATSIPSDRDGDGHPNDEDAYPDDPARWDWEPEDDLPPPDEDDETKGGIGAIFIWAGIGILVSVIAAAVVVVYMVKGRKRKDEDDAEKMADASGDEDELGRVNAEGGNE